MDPEWYRARNPDVARRDLDPLEHFIVEGIIDRRRPNAGMVLPSEPVTAARIDWLKGGAVGAGGSWAGAAAEVALFATHAPDGRVKPHVAHHVACLRRCGIACMLVVACDAPGAALTGAAVDLADQVFCRANGGFDFAAWAHVLHLHLELFEAPILYLVNDSVFGPTSEAALETVIERERGRRGGLDRQRRPRLARAELLPRAEGGLPRLEGRQGFFRRGPLLHTRTTW